MKTQNIRNIIFDLGAVIINLDVQKTIEQFAVITGADIQTIATAYFKAPFFLDYEIGQITDQQFRDAVRKIANKHIDDQRIDDAWNAMLLDLPAERLEWVRALKPHFRIVVLSNTNAIHIRKFLEIFKEQTPYAHPDEVFDHMYYSHEIHLRKPLKPCFEYVLNHAGFKAEETLLLDDNADNIATAKSLNMHTVHVEANKLSQTMLSNGAI
ncbi:MAG: HAD family hydrolase [Cyclobacteriaceae bacterium]